MRPSSLLFLIGAFVTNARSTPVAKISSRLLQGRPAILSSVASGQLTRGLAETITKPSRVEEKGEDDGEGDNDDASEEGDVEAEGDDDTAAESDGDTTEMTAPPPPKKKGKKGATTTPPKKKGKKVTTTTTPEPEDDDEDDETPAPPPPPPAKKKGKKKPVVTTTPEPEGDDEEGEESPPPVRAKKPKKASGPPSDDENDGEGDAGPPPPASGGKKGGKKKGSTPPPTKTPPPTDEDGSTKAPKWTPELKAGKFVDFHDIIEYFVQNDHDRTFSGMLVFQIIKFRNGDAAIEKRFIDRLVKCLKPALPELRVLATLRRRMRQGLAGKDRDQARGLAARTVTTAIKHFYYAADEEGIPVRLIVGVINAMHTFEQASYSNPLEEKPGSGLGGGPGSRDGGESGTGKGNDGFNRSSSRLRDSYLSFEEELERLLDEIESDIMDDYEASLRGQYLPGGGTLDDDMAQQDIMDAIGALSLNADDANIYGKLLGR